MVADRGLIPANIYITTIGTFSNHARVSEYKNKAPRAIRAGRPS